MTKQKIIKTLSHIEKTGVGFWNRNSDNTITIHICGSDGNDWRQWHNAREIESFFSKRIVKYAEMDRQCGNIAITIKGFYRRGA